MNTLKQVEVSLVDGRPMVSSLKVAEHFGKQHFVVLRTIKNLDIPKSFSANNFVAVEYVDKKGEKRPAYNMTRDGFTLLAMGFTGKKAMKWKIRYIEAFNAMEKELIKRLRQDMEALSPEQQLAMRRAVDAKVELLPEKLRRKAYGQAWARIQNKFKVASYKQIKQKDFQKALEYVESMELNMELPCSQKRKDMSCERLLQLHEMGRLSKRLEVEYRELIIKLNSMVTAISMNELSVPSIDHKKAVEGAICLAGTGCDQIKSGLHTLLNGYSLLVETLEGKPRIT
jgi:Rha family phage regulatory protein